MDPKLQIYEHFDLIFNSNINVKHNNFLYIHLKKNGDCKNAIR